MEIPKELKTLYKHWETHTKPVEVTSNAKLPTGLPSFIAERMGVWEKKAKGENTPYTNDEILQKYRFCNIYRELDKQTIQIHKDLKPLEKNFPLWLLNLAFHRFICRPETVQKVGHLSLDEKENKKVYEKLNNLPRPKYGSAYVFPISVIQKSQYPTREEFFCFYLPKTIPEIAEEIEKFENVPVNKALKILLPKFGYNFRFHWTEILIDVAYQFPNKIDLFRDFYVGPGALPTAKLLNPNKAPSEVVDDCVGTELKDFPFLTYNSSPVKLSAENWEGVFCEYRKYTNLKAGKGRRRRF